MSVQIAASQSALNDASLPDFNDPSYLPDSYTTAFLGFDFSSLGARATEVPGEYGSEMAVSNLDLPLFIASVNAAFQGGIDYIQLNKEFHTVSEGTGRTSKRALLADSLKAAGMIAQMENAGGVTIELPLAAGIDFAAAIDFLGKYAGKKSVAAVLTTAAELPLFHKLAQAAHANGMKLVAIGEDCEFFQEHAEQIVDESDMLQLRAGELAKVRTLRFTAQSLAAKLGREIKLVVEMGIVISATAQAANERAALLQELSHAPLFAHMPHAVGTVYDVADHLEKWIGFGAVDGIVFHPASLPTDLASVLKGVLPLLRERAKIDFLGK